MTNGQLLGLGILLNVVDEASEPLRRVANMLGVAQRNAQNTSGSMNVLEQNLSALALGATSFMYTGERLIRGGTRILGVFKAMGNQMIKTGTQFEGYRKTLKSLYGDEQLAKDKVNWAMDLAANTPFEIQDVMGALIGMKAVGIEADSTFANANGEMRTFIEYVGDLASLRPDVGMDGVMIGIRNYLGGNARSLNERMDIDIEEILGRKMGATSTDRISDIVELSQKLAKGLMKEMEGTWQHLMSTFRGQITRLLLSVAESGIFDKIKSTISKVVGFINAIPGSELEVIGKNLSGIFDDLWEPLDKLATTVVTMLGAIKDLVMENPEVIKTIVQLSLLASGLLIAVGSLSMLGGVIGFVKLGLSQLGGTLSSFIMPLGLVTAGIWILSRLWKDDFLGLKTNTQSFLKDTITFIGLLIDAWDYSMSDDNFVKAQELGMLGLIETILDCKLKVEAFLDGFIEGVKGFITVIGTIAKPVIDCINSVLEYFNLVQQPGEFDTSGWKKFGEVVAWLTGIFITFMTGSKIFSFITKIVGGIGTLISTISGVVSTIAGGFSFISGILSSIFAYLAPLLSPILLNPITLGIGAVIGMMWLWASTNEDVKERFLEAWERVKDMFRGLLDFITGVFTLDWQKAADGLCSIFVNAFKAIVNLASPILNTIIDMVNHVIRAINSISFTAPDWDWLPDSIQGKTWGPTLKELPSIPKLNTGGYVKNEGISMLHPNEVVVNDPLTRKLRAFLDSSNAPASSPSSGLTTSSTNNSTQSLVVEKGAIIIEVANGSIADAQNIANEVLKKIEQKAKIKKLVSYQ